MKETKYEIGNRIRKYREECNMTQKQLAERIGVSNSRVSNWEQGLNRPDADILAAVCVALDVSPRLQYEDHNETGIYDFLFRKS